MKSSEICAHVDHTLLNPFATWEEIKKLCEEAIQFHTASICIPPCYIARVHKKYGSRINIGTVIGFPLGYSVTSAKMLEARQAVQDGANEVDMVINITDAKNHKYEKIENEIKCIREIVASPKILKVIIETCYLSESEKIALCEVVTNAQADYIKTSTGMGPNGATASDIRLFKEHIGSDIKMKAAGGIRTVEDMEQFLEEGCDRLGTSSAIKILAGQKASGY